MSTLYDIVKMRLRRRTTGHVNYNTSTATGNEYNGNLSLPTIERILHLYPEPLKAGEVRKVFCGVLNKNTLYVKKEKSGQICYFAAYSDETLTDRLGEVNAANSELGMMNIKENAQKCGIGTLLTYLCMIDTDVNPVHGGTYLDIKNEFEGYRKITKLMGNNSNGLFKILVVADKYGGNAYFNAAIAANYERVMVFESKKAIVYELGTAKQDYNSDRFNFTYWYFCKKYPCSYDY